MKTTITMLGAALSLALTQQALANQVIALQEGDRNTNIIIQTGDGQYADSLQEGDRNILTLVQVNSDNDASFTTLGDLNLVYSLQDGTSNVMDMNIYGDANTLISWQLGDENSASIQFGSPQSGPGNANPPGLNGGPGGGPGAGNPGGPGNGNPGGGPGGGNPGNPNPPPFNSANPVYHNDVLTFQSGTLNSLTLLISGDYNMVDIEQYGDNNLVAGLAGEAAFKVAGDGGQVWLRQFGTDNQVFGAQHSHSSMINVEQIGHANKAMVLQH